MYYDDSALRKWLAAKERKERNDAAVLLDGNGITLPYFVPQYRSVAPCWHVCEDFMGVLHRCFEYLTGLFPFYIAFYSWLCQIVLSKGNV